MFLLQRLGRVSRIKGADLEGRTNYEVRESRRRDEHRTLFPSLYHVQDFIATWRNVEARQIAEYVSESYRTKEIEASSHSQSQVGPFVLWVYILCFSRSRMFCKINTWKERIWRTAVLYLTSILKFALAFFCALLSCSKKELFSIASDFFLINGDSNISMNIGSTSSIGEWSSLPATRWFCEGVVSAWDRGDFLFIWFLLLFLLCVQMCKGLLHTLPHVSCTVGHCFDESQALQVPSASSTSFMTCLFLLTAQAEIMSTREDVSYDYIMQEVFRTPPRDEEPSKYQEPEQSPSKIALKKIPRKPPRNLNASVHTNTFQ